MSNQESGGFFPYGEYKSTAAFPQGKEDFATYTREWSGLDYADQRWYASGAGRFTTSDPYVRDEDTTIRPNLFTYSFGDPVNLYDPRGLDEIRIDIEVCYDGELYRNDGHGNLIVVGIRRCFSDTFWMDDGDEESVDSGISERSQRLRVECEREAELNLTGANLDVWRVREELYRYKRRQAHIGAAGAGVASLLSGGGFLIAYFIAWTAAEISLDMDMQREDKMTFFPKYSKNAEEFRRMMRDCEQRFLVKKSRPSTSKR